MRDTEFLGVALICHEKLLELNLAPFSFAILKFPNHVSTIVELVPLTPENSYMQTSKDKNVLILHPIIEETLILSSSQSSHDCRTTSLLPTQFIIRMAVEQETSSTNVVHTMSAICELEPLENVVCVEPEGDLQLEIHLHLIYCTNDDYEARLTSSDTSRDDICSSYLQKQVTENLFLKCVAESAFVFIPLPPVPSISNQSQVAIFQVGKLEVRTENGNSENPINCKQSFRIRSTRDIKTIIASTALVDNSVNISQETILTCPGYNSLIEEILSLANLPVKDAAPTGVLVAGCKGVGKSRLAAVILQTLLGHSIGSSSILSTNDVILQASTTSDISQLKKYIEKFIITSKRHQKILIIDDLDSAITDDDDSIVDTEKRNTLNAILSVIDTLHFRTSIDTESFPVFILGFCCDEASIPASLMKVGRFEKTISMFPPTEKQRQQILNEMMKSLPIDAPDMDDNETRTKWSTVIAQYTGGCVTSDLKGICVDALTRSIARSKANSLEVIGVQWDDIKEATRNCMPSQLAQLDVTLTRDMDEVNIIKYESLKDEFFASFHNFGGYDELKAKIYRSVILPWKRWNPTTVSSTDYISSLERTVRPPTGVLFHGPSGTGKTFAAECLASALRLNVIRVSTVSYIDITQISSIFLILDIDTFLRHS